MRTFFAIAALAAGLASNVADAGAVNRHQRAGVIRPAAPASFQSLYQDAAPSNACEGRRIFGFCPVR